MQPIIEDIEEECRKKGIHFKILHITPALDCGQYWYYLVSGYKPLPQVITLAARIAKSDSTIIDLYTLQPID